MSRNSPADLQSIQSVEELQRLVTTLRTENAILRKELLTAERERIEYLQNVAHQLVAPLNAIKWHIENLTSNRINPERARKVLRSIYSQATIAVHLAKNFVFMSNLEADHTMSAFKELVETVNVEQMLVNLADDFQPLSWDKSVHISVSDDSHHAPDVRVMKNLISQVFSNIIENAVKYSDEDTTVRISIDYDEEEDEVVVRIRSRGIPLEEKEMIDIFNRGFRSQRAREKHPAGTGFGLYIASKILSVHDGEIRAYSEPPKDTIFEVRLPHTIEAT
jgi:signal transduction histidine kinase